jgi:peptidylprolyl isomerase
MISRRSVLSASFIGITAAFGLSVAAFAASHAADPENTLLIELKDGTVKIDLAEDVAPQHTERLKALAREGFYDGVVFHRVIDGFMAQTGDPTGTGMGGSEKPDLPAEFSKVPFERGTVGMARSQNPNSANSQFFIMFDEGSFLNGQYTVVGQVVEGMEYVDAIKKGDQAANGQVQNPDKMLKVQVAADAK